MAFVLIIAGAYIIVVNDEKPTKIYANNNTNQNNSGDNFYIENTTNTTINTTIFENTEKRIAHILIIIELLCFAFLVYLT